MFLWYTGALEKNQMHAHTQNTSPMQRCTNHTTAFKSAYGSQVSQLSRVNMSSKISSTPRITLMIVIDEIRIHRRLMAFRCWS